MTYGSDFAGTEDLDFGLTFLEGDQEPLALSQAVARRFLTPRGGLFYAADYGLDIRLFLVDTIPLTMAQGLIAAEARKDERIVKADCTITVDENGAWIVAVHAFGDTDQDFTLTFLATPEKVILL